MNTTKAVLGASSSTIPEVDAFIEFLHTERREKVTKVAAVIDNVTAISFIECYAKKDIICGRMMQHFLLKDEKIYQVKIMMMMIIALLLITTIQSTMEAPIWRKIRSTQ